MSEAGSDDSEVRKAIQRSLRDQKMSKKAEVVDLISDSDEELPPKKAHIPAKTDVSTDEVKETTASSFARLGLDRKKMEEERLARRKRTAKSISPPPLRNEAKRARPLPSHTLSYSSNQSSHSTPVSVNLDIYNETPRLSGMQYPDGILKKTWVLGYDRKGDDIKIEEVFQKSTLKLAVLSSFDWDVEWVLSKFMSRAMPPLVFIRQAKDRESKEQFTYQLSEFPSIKLVFPPMGPGIFCMHAKLQLLFHQAYLRVSVPSANLRQHDWGENGGILENSVFLIDLPALPAEQKGDEESLPPFGRELLRFCRAMGLQEGIIQELLKYDFAKAQKYGFVHTIGGSNVGDAAKYTGYCGLGAAVRELGLATKSHPEVDFVSSSIGALTISYLKTLYGATIGLDAHEEFEKLGSTKAAAKKSFFAGASATQATDELAAAVNKHFRFYFPSRETVLESKGKGNAGGTNFLAQKTYTKEGFPKHLMRDCISTRPGMLMHNKMILVRPPKTVHSTVLDADYVAWAYHGSANISESAWGKLSSTSGTLKLVARNWECGVLIPIPLQENAFGQKGRTVGGDEEYPGIEVFEPFVHVPMEVPGEPYTSKNPWYAAWN